MNYERVLITELKDKIFNNVSIYDDTIEFFIDDKLSYKMEHRQDCCENVYIDDIVGDINDLVDTPILDAYESTNNENPKPNSESFTWTFYNISTIKGSVTIKWYGASNGYYSETADLYKIIN